MTTQVQQAKKPVYGTVAQCGGEWSVTMEAVHTGGECYTTGHISGYGDFPHADYPGIPVIRFDQADIDDVLRAIRGEVDYIAGCCNPVHTNTDLTRYLRKMLENNIPVENWVDCHAAAYPEDYPDPE